MKTLKSVLLVAAAAVAAALLVGAGWNNDARPSSVDAKYWVSINDKAGFALTSMRGDSIGAELYVKTDTGWLRARVENPVVVTPVRH